MRIQVETQELIFACRSPGFGLTLVAESTTGVMHAAESSTYSHAAMPTSVTAERVGGARGHPEEGNVLPEDVGENTASQLIQEIVKVRNDSF